MNTALPTASCAALGRGTGVGVGGRGVLVGGGGVLFAPQATANEISRVENRMAR